MNPSALCDGKGRGKNNRLNNLINGFKLFQHHPYQLWRVHVLRDRLGVPYNADSLEASENY